LILAGNGCKERKEEQPSGKAQLKASPVVTLRKEIAMSSGADPYEGWSGLEIEKGSYRRPQVVMESSQKIRLFARSTVTT
jgi:hypothetical protein